MSSFWTDDNVAKLRKAVLDGKSAGEAALLFHGAVTREACVGKAHRLGLRFGSASNMNRTSPEEHPWRSGGKRKAPEGDAPATPPTASTRAPRAPVVAPTGPNPMGRKSGGLRAPDVKRARHAANGVNAGQALVVQIATGEPRKAPSVPKLRGQDVPCSPKPYGERRFGQCVYPVAGEGADTMSCCNPAPDNRYCTAHAAICYAPVTGKRAELKEKPSGMAIRLGRVA